MARRKAAKNPVALSTHRKIFVDLLNKIAAGGQSRWNIFTDFLALSAISLAACDKYGLLTDKETLDEREERYKQIIGKYRKEHQPLFGEMLAALAEEMQTYCPNHLTDVLGELFHSLEFQDEWKGQFFTPQNVCDMIGMMNFGDAAADVAIKEKGFVTINEPCCGAGALILGACNGMRHAGFNPNTQALVVANDLDERCVHMCYIQLSLYGIPAIVQRQNSLTQETFGAPWITPVFLFDGWIWKWRRWLAPPAEPEKPAVKESPAAEETVPVEVIELQRGQMSLF